MMADISIVDTSTLFVEISQLKVRILGVRDMKGTHICGDLVNVCF